MSGEGKIDGASGARIKSQLQSIVNELNRSSTTKIKFQYEFDVKKVEKEINNATKKAVEPKTSKYSKGLVNYYKDLEKQSDSFNKKNISGIDFEIKKREESGRRFSHQIKAQMTEAERLKKAVSNSQNALLGMGGNADERTYANTGIKAVTDAYEKYLRIVKEAQVAEKAIDSNNPQTQQAFIDKVNEAKIAQQQLNAVLHNSTAFEKQETIYQKVIARITEYQAKFKETLKNTPQLAAQLEELRQKLDSNTFVGTENKANQMFVSLTNQIRQAGGEAETLGQKIRRIFGEKLGYGIIASAAMMARRSIREMYNNVVQIDTAMTELKKVTNETDESYRRFLDGSAERAQKLGAKISDVVTATADFARLGYNLEDASILSDTATIYKNVGDGISDINSASESIISTMKAFGYEASDAMSIVDKFNEVGNNYAISSKGVGDALLNSASAMAAANNTLDETIALSTAANTIVQNPEKVGTALKTVSMYLRAAKDDAEDMGESTEGMAESVSELQSKLLSLTGGKVNILEADGQTYKSTYQILKELSEVYDSLSDVSQANILELIGGKRNSNITAALLEGFDVAEKSLATSMDSAGSALEENEKYLDSINGKVAQLEATFQDLSQNVIDSELVKGFVDLGNGALKLVNFLAEIKALLPAIVAGFMSWKNVGKLNSPNMPAYAQLQLVA